MEAEDIQEFYAKQSPATDPGEYAYLFEGMSPEVPGIVASVQGVILNLAEVENEHIPIPGRTINREIHLYRVEDMLKAISKKDRQPLAFPRTIENRIVGICAHYALLTCSVLRYKGIPARLRGGFENYYSPDKHHDHWICEYWKASEQRWVRIDPEINDKMIKGMHIDFNSLDLPRNIFITGTEAWQACRSGMENPYHFGVMGNHWDGGWDFVLNEMVLDFMALNKTELLPWADTRLSGKGFNHLTRDEYTLLDEASKVSMAGDDSFDTMRRLFKSNKKLKR